jgi:hypothetical protein
MEFQAMRFSQFDVENTSMGRYRSFYHCLRTAIIEICSAAFEVLANSFFLKMM